MKYLKKKNLDFIAASRMKCNAGSFCMSKRVLMMCPALLILFISVTASAILLWQAAAANREAKEISGTLETGYALADQGEEDQGMYRYHRLLEALEKAGNKIEEVPGIRGSELDTVYHLASEAINVDSVDYQNGCFTIIANTGDYREGSAYAQRLETAEIFERVLYEGFTREEREDGAAIYRFTITALSARNNGTDADEEELP